MWCVVFFTGSDKYNQGDLFFAHMYVRTKPRFENIVRI